MNQRKPNGPRAQQRPQQGPQQGPQSKKAQSWWYHHRYHPYYDWYDWYDYDYYDYDYDWYDYDYDYTYDSPPNRPKRPQPPRGPVKTADYSEDSAAYQQGFKDGWKAAMDYCYGYSMGPVEPMPTPPMPTPPMPTPLEGAPE